MNVNSWGMESHPSDAIVHWSEIRPHDKNFRVYITNLRAAWNLIHSGSVILKAHQLILDQTLSYEQSLQGEIEAGEDL